MQIQLRQKGKDIPLTVSNGCVTVYIEEYEVPALVDTGASISVIRKDFLATIRAPDVKCMPCNIKIHLADGSTTFCKEKVKLPFKVGTLHCVVEFKVLSSLSRPLILGVDFLERYEGAIKYGKRITDVIRPIRALSNLVIPPMTEVTMSARVVSERQYDKNIDVGVSENLDRGNVRQVPFLVKRTLITPDVKHKVPVSLLNCTNHYRKIKKGQVIGLYVPQQQDELKAIDDQGLLASLLPQVAADNAHPVQSSDPLVTANNTHSPSPSDGVPGFISSQHT